MKLKSMQYAYHIRSIQTKSTCKSVHLLTYATYFNLVYTFTLHRLKLIQNLSIVTILAGEHIFQILAQYS